MLPTRATGACVYEPRSFGPGLGTDTDTASRAVLESTTCPKGQRIESLWVYHGHWVDGIRLKCSDVPDDEFEVDDKYLIGQGDDSSYTPVCEQEGGSGLNNITAVFSSGNTNYLADMVVTCLNGDENMNGFGNNFNSR